MKSNNIKLNQSNVLVNRWPPANICNFQYKYSLNNRVKSNKYHRSVEAIDKLLKDLLELFIKKYIFLKERLIYGNYYLNSSSEESMIFDSKIFPFFIFVKPKNFNLSDIPGISLDNECDETKQPIANNFSAKLILNEIQGA